MLPFYFLYVVRFRGAKKRRERKRRRAERAWERRTDVRMEVREERRRGGGLSGVWPSEQ